MASLQFGEWSYLIEDASVLSCVHSPDGKTCAAGVKDGMISVYDTTTWTKTHTLSGHTDVVRGMVYSPSGHQIASCSDDKTVRLWDAQTGTPGFISSGHTDDVNIVAYSPSGHQIASCSHDKTVRLWDVKSGQCLAFIEGSFTSIAWNTIPNSTYFVTGCEDTSVRMWQVTEEENHFQVRLHWSSMHDALVVSNTSIQNVQGLSRINMRLLEQRGAVGEPILPSSFREAGKKLISMASVASKLKLPSNHDTLDTNLTTDSPAVQSAKSVDSADVSSLA
ncbi:WD40-repeat-containing domain protein [Gamsiella multidivaricata]|uniref:WD40-repeat-containing domain protein n=1 Tax=Gamsiella multidivaricata TaxID=101098 RepID=UPI00221EDAF9|nr:WD40-repeat-containing domain protein [Gamsiella multidivaricata]KAI7832258.1 WD40-repeat-containing domain protein [Gamsiella multidivaricata]